MINLHELFALNRPLVLFVYGQTFFVMGLAIFLQSRRHSRLRLARDLRWLAAFGILHGFYEWGDVFIPIQTTYLPHPYVALLLILHIIILALSFTCLLAFGAATLQMRWQWGWKFVVAVALIWGLLFWVTLYSARTFDDWHHIASIWSRYLLGLPGALLAAYGLRYQAETTIAPLGVGNIYRILRIAGISLLAYAFLGGLVVGQAEFFPANVLNKTVVENLVGIPIEVFRSIASLILAVTMIRTLEVFEIEVDRMIEAMGVDRIEAAERDRIGQEIHDGAIQAVYSASLILESMQPYMEANTEAAMRLDRAKRVLGGAITDLRQYMVSLKSGIPLEPLGSSLRRLIADPRFSSLVQIQLKMNIEPDMKPVQVGHTLAIVQECFSNTLRHAQARHITVEVCRELNNIAVIIQDDGQGFDEQKITPGYGLRTIRDRARLLGATLEIQSRPGKGTITTLLVPIGES